MQLVRLVLVAQSTTFAAMSRSWFLLVLLLAGCGGSLTDEQRKKIKEEMERGTIQKVSEVEIQEGALAIGRSITSKLNANSIHRHSYVDSLERVYKVDILLLQPGDSMLLGIEQQIIEAYTAGSDSIELADNVQRTSKDTLLYTKPILKKNSNGSMEFDYAVGVRMPKKQVILSLRK